MRSFKTGTPFEITVLSVFNSTAHDKILRDLNRDFGYLYEKKSSLLRRFLVCVTSVIFGWILHDLVFMRYVRPACVACRAVPKGSSSVVSPVRRSAFPPTSVDGIFRSEKQYETRRGSMAEITNPHDRFFKEVFSRSEVAEDFLFHYLPPDVSGLLRPGTFRLSKGSFVDANLTEYFSDLLYQVDFQSGEQGFVYILFEHKSYPAPDIAFQLLRYMTRIWEYGAKQVRDSLPAVIPVVLYHGTVKWSIPLNFASLYRAPESLKASLWDFTYTLCDLSAYADEKIKLGVMARVALLLLKHVHSKDLPQRLRDIFGMLRAMNEQTALEFLETVLRYLGAAGETVTMEDCRKAVKATFPESGEIFMERWIEEIAAERHQEWRAEGLKDGATAVTIRLLARKLGDLDAAVEKRVRQLSFEELEKLGEDLLDFRNSSALTEWLDRAEKSR